MSFENMTSVGLIIILVMQGLIFFLLGLLVGIYV